MHLGLGSDESPMVNSNLLKDIQFAGQQIPCSARPEA